MKRNNWICLHIFKNIRLFLFIYFIMGLYTKVYESHFMSPIFYLHSISNKQYLRKKNNSKNYFLHIFALIFAFSKNIFERVVFVSQVFVAIFYCYPHSVQIQLLQI